MTVANSKAVTPLASVHVLPQIVTLSLFTSNSEVVSQDPFFSIWMGHLLPVLNFATGWQGQSRAVVLTQTDIRVIAFASGQPPTPPSVAIPKPRFAFWGDGNLMLLKSTFAYLVCKVHLLVSALLLRQLLVWNMAASRP